MNGKFAVVCPSLSNVLSETARKFDEMTVRHTAPRRKWPDRIALHSINGGGKEVYLASTEFAGLAFPFRNSSKGFSKHRLRLRTIQIGSSNVAKIVGR